MLGSRVVFGPLSTYGAAAPSPRGFSSSSSTYGAAAPSPRGFRGGVAVGVVGMLATVLGLRWAAGSGARERGPRHSPDGSTARIPMAVRQVPVVVPVSIRFRKTGETPVNINFKFTTFPKHPITFTSINAIRASRVRRRGDLHPVYMSALSALSHAPRPPDRGGGRRGGGLGVCCDRRGQAVRRRRRARCIGRSFAFRPDRRVLRSHQASI